MRKPSRRDTLAALSGAGVAALLAARPGAALALHTPAGGDLLVVGPLGVGDWYARLAAKIAPIGPVEIGADPGHDALVAGLNRCRLFLIDRRDSSDPKAPKFTPSNSGFPLLVAGGELLYEWRDGPKVLTARVVSLRADVSSTRYEEPGGLTRTSVAEVRIEVKGSAGLLRAECVLSMIADPAITYDLAGNLLRMAGAD
jgi:hypothetical protein